MSLMACAAICSVAFAGLAQVHTLAALPPRQVSMQKVRRRQRAGGSLAAVYSAGRCGPGWSVRQVKRMALKRRNQVRHRAVCRRRH
jgi:hypothetical protein